MSRMRDLLDSQNPELEAAGSRQSWHDLYKGSSWIYVGGLDYGLTEGDIEAVFSQYGKIVQLNYVKDRDTGKPKGFSFIMFEDQRSTILSVDNLNGIRLCNRFLKVDHVKDYKPGERDGGPSSSSKYPGGGGSSASSSGSKSHHGGSRGSRYSYNYNSGPGGGGGSSRQDDKKRPGFGYSRKDAEREYNESRKYRSSSSSSSSDSDQSPPRSRSSGRRRSRSRDRRRSRSPRDTGPRYQDISPEPSYSRR